MPFPMENQQIWMMVEYVRKTRVLGRKGHLMKPWAGQLLSEDDTAPA